MRVFNGDARCNALITELLHKIVTEYLIDTWGAGDMSIAVKLFLEENMRQIDRKSLPCPS